MTINVIVRNETPKRLPLSPPSRKLPTLYVASRPSTLDVPKAYTETSHFKSLKAKRMVSTLGEVRAPPPKPEFSEPAAVTAPAIEESTPAAEIQVQIQKPASASDSGRPQKQKKKARKRPQILASTDDGSLAIDPDLKNMSAADPASPDSEE